MGKNREGKRKEELEKRGWGRGYIRERSRGEEEGEKSGEEL